MCWYLNVCVCVGGELPVPVAKASKKRRREADGCGWSWWLVFRSRVHVSMYQVGPRANCGHSYVHTFPLSLLLCEL